MENGIIARVSRTEREQNPESSDRKITRERVVLVTIFFIGMFLSSINRYFKLSPRQKHKFRKSIVANRNNFIKYKINTNEFKLKNIYKLYKCTKKYI